MFKSRSPSAAFAVMLAIGAGCGRTASDPPRFDYSAARLYPTAEFKDNAPANATAPEDFPLDFVDADGQSVDLTQFRGKRKVVLVVLRGVARSERGGLCPTCLAQTGSLMANRDEFARRGAAVLVVFPGPSERLPEFLERAKQITPGEPDKDIRVLLDRECAACRRLGIRDDLAKPSTYILDTHGKVVYAYVGETSTDRPSVKAVLAQLDITE